ncbi:MAG: hypothetical protein KGL39_03550 [Patescibacteria group bacterium]|nr:hypothetical protein [Patescibacteria group bacterium]
MSRNVSYFDNAATVTPSDSANLPTEACALFVGTGGNVKVDTVGGQTGVTIAVANNAVVPLHVKKVYATGTTASGISGLW